MRKIVSILRSEISNIDYSYDMNQHIVEATYGEPDEHGNRTMLTPRSDPDTPAIRKLNGDNVIGDRKFMSVCKDTDEIYNAIVALQPESCDLREATAEEIDKLKVQKMSETKRVNDETKINIRKEFSVEEELKIYRTDDTAGKARIAEIIEEGNTEKTRLGY
tara:strand:- start:997 stop:1482 length:486 start_codon:yes stop_codon:yes gene_type:complete